MFLHEIDNELKELAFNFFYKYSRFEYSLKANGFCRADNKESKASADWQKFREQHEDRYHPTEEAFGLLADPPKVQVFKDSRLSFVPEETKANDTDLRKVLRAIHRVRNNLFHGGKQGIGTEGELQRNKYLLTTASRVLDQLSKIDASVEFDYPGKY